MPDIFFLFTSWKSSRNTAMLVPKFPISLFQEKTILCQSLNWNGELSTHFSQSIFQEEILSSKTCPTYTSYPNEVLTSLQNNSPFNAVPSRQQILGNLLLWRTILDAKDEQCFY